LWRCIHTRSTCFGTRSAYRLDFVTFHVAFSTYRTTWARSAEFMELVVLYDAAAA
jgi:hypothetical protein